MQKSLVWIAPLVSVNDGLAVMVLNLGPLLRAAGYKVHLLVSALHYNPALLDSIVASGAIDSHSSLPTYYAAGWQSAISRVFIHPVVKNRFRRPLQAPLLDAIRRQLRQQQATALLMADRSYLFMLPELRKELPVTVNWCDSFTLACWRQLRLAYQQGRWSRLPSLGRQLLAELSDESYYPRFAQGNLSVSPVDQGVIGKLSGQPITRLSLGVDSITPPPMEHKVPYRLVFSGVMDFEPNYQSALWFLDNVLPLVRARKPEVHLVLAGRDPVPELRARASAFVSVTGRVPDMAKEIAQAHLYVAPMVSGSGFKNKVVEALAAGSAVVGTTLAAEFLDPDLQRLIPTSNDPAQLAAAIVQVLELPLPVLEQRILEAQQYLRGNYSWQQSAHTLLSILDPKLEHSPKT